MFWRRKADKQLLDNMHSEAETLKSAAIKQTRQATNDIRRLNQLLTTNGITIKIHRVAGGDHKHE